MLIYGLGRVIQADREREIQERLRHRGLLRDALEAKVTGRWPVVTTGPKEPRPEGRRRWSVADVIRRIVSGRGQGATRSTTASPAR
jgi:hypothetical protein